MRKRSPKDLGGKLTVDQNTISPPHSAGFQAVNRQPVPTIPPLPSRGEELVREMTVKYQTCRA